MVDALKLVANRLTMIEAYLGFSNSNSAYAQFLPVFVADDFTIVLFVPVSDGDVGLEAPEAVGVRLLR